MRIIIKVMMGLLLLVVACKSVDCNNEKNNTEIQHSELNKIATDKFGENFSKQYNGSKDYVLCKSTTKLKIPNDSIINYFVYDIQKKIIIEENKIISGSVSWVSDYEIKVVTIPGIIKKNEDQQNGYILNLKTNLKTKLDGGVN